MKSRLQWSPVWRFYERRKVRFWVSSTFHILEDPTLRFAFAKTSLAPATRNAPWPIRIKAKTWHDNGCSVSSRSMRKAIYYAMYHASSLYVVHICNICTYYIYIHIGFRVCYTYGSYRQCNPTYVNQQTKRRRAADKKKEWHLRGGTRKVGKQERNRRKNEGERAGKKT